MSEINHILRAKNRIVGPIASDAGYFGSRSAHPSNFDGSMSTTPGKLSKGRSWSAEVTKHSDALDLKSEVFKRKDPHRIALSLKRSAERSKRRKGTRYQSAMSMLNFRSIAPGKICRKDKSRFWKRQKMNCATSLGAIRWHALAKQMRLCRLIFAPSAIHLPSSSREADPP